MKKKYLKSKAATIKTFPVNFLKIHHYVVYHTILSEQIPNIAVIQ